MARARGRAGARSRSSRLTVSEAAADALRERRRERARRRPTRSSRSPTSDGFCARAAARRGARGRRRPVRRAGDARRPARDAARAHRRAAARLARPPRQPERAARLVVARIDRLKDELVSHEDYAAWAASSLGPDATRAAREREFADHLRRARPLLEEAGTLDFGDLVLRRLPAAARAPARARAGRPSATATCSSTSSQDANFAQGLLLRAARAPSTARLTVAGDDDQAIHRFRGAAAKNLRDFEAEWPGRDGRAARASASAAAQRVLDGRARGRRARRPTGSSKELRGAETGGEVAFWRAAERARAGAGRRGRHRAPRRARGRRARAHRRARALGAQTRARPSRSRSRSARCRYRLVGAAAFFQRAEVRDLLAWLRLLVDPGDAGAVVRALARPPVELRSIDLARCTQIARRRKLDMVAALGAAIESPQIPPEARERIRAFLKLYRAASAALDSDAPRPLRAPPDRAARAAPAAAVRRLGRGRRAAREPRASSASSRPPTCAARRRRPRATSRARRRGRRGRAARGGGARPATAARRAGDGDARRQGPRVRPRLRARPDRGADAGAAAAHARADPRRAAQGGAAAATPRPRTSPRCAGCCTWR